MCAEQIKSQDFCTPNAYEHYKMMLQAYEELNQTLQKATQALYESYHQYYALYKGEPILRDKNGTELHLQDKVLVPSPRPNDLWETEYEGTIISTTCGDGVVCVWDMDQDCWKIDSTRVTKL
jgi:hypothetical protein